MTPQAKNTAPGTEAGSNPRAALWPNYKPPAELVFTHGIGSELFSEDGTSYLDFLSGIAVTSFGHAHPHLVNALSEQATKLWHTSNVFRIPAAERLAQRLVESSFADGVYFANSGTEAVEAGLKSIRAYQAVNKHPERYRIIGFEASFHGRTMASLAAAGNPAHMKNFVHGDYGFDQAQWDDIESVKSCIDENTAGIIIEPVQGEGGIRPASKEFLKALRELCDDHGLLLMFDEVQCGIGRSGKLFAHENYSLEPDVMAIAKGLGGGFPVGACLASEAVSSTMQLGSHGSTFGGNQLAMAVADAVLDLVLEPSLLKDVNNKAKFLVTELEALTKKYPQSISSVHGLGLMLGLKCVGENTKLLLKLREHGLLVGKSGDNMIRLLPPLNVSQIELERALDIIRTVLKNSEAN
jgi:acetylornithine/N-succinyldiaminopimelate aminotransferase|tara:strand:- start:2432 stop:3661 length:1230 start_codon:yes stop_codon:yes gene_type:complete